jgi:hypothetical protein
MARRSGRTATIAVIAGLLALAAALHLAGGDVMDALRALHGR